MALHHDPLFWHCHEQEFTEVAYMMLNSQSLRVGGTTRKLTCLDPGPSPNGWLPSHNWMNNNCIFLGNEKKHAVKFVMSFCAFHPNSYISLCNNTYNPTLEHFKPINSVPTMTWTSSRMIQLISLAPGPIRALADIETLGPICFIKFQKLNITDEVERRKRKIKFPHNDTK